MQTGLGASDPEQFRAAAVEAYGEEAWEVLEPLLRQDVRWAKTSSGHKRSSRP